MILSTGRRYLFIHIPKTGGTSLALALEARAMRDDMMLGDTPKARKRRRRLQDVRTRGRLWKHSTLSDIEGLVSDDVLGGLFAFTLVRNPWDRAVSYYHWLREQRFEHPAVELAQNLPFDAFVADRTISTAFRTNPYSSYMRRSDGVERCDAYIRIERFQEDAASLFTHLGFEFELPTENTSPRTRDYRQYYSDASAEAIGQSCAEDISGFGYRFDPTIK